MKHLLKLLLVLIFFNSNAYADWTYLFCKQEYVYKDKFDDKKFKSILNKENEDNKNKFKIDENKLSSNWIKIKEPDQNNYRLSIQNNLGLVSLIKNNELLTIDKGYSGRTNYILESTKEPRFNFYISRNNGQFIFTDLEENKYYSGFCKKEKSSKNNYF